MKKLLVFAVVLALLVPAAAFGATEFSLGGFIKLDAYWSSSQQYKNIYLAPARNNDSSYHHGHMKFNAQGSRFSLTIKGPKLWGANVTGFLEMDFDPTPAPIANTSFTTSNSYTPRLRHAMFRFNWPTSELLFGQYWSFFCEWYAESAEDGPMMMTGTPTHRFAQIRFTQQFMSDWTVAALVGDPSQARLTTVATNAYSWPLTAGSAFPAYNNGESAESPLVQGKISYAHDFYGKAAYYGKPTPLTVQFAGAWQRNVIRTNQYAVQTLGSNINGAGVVVENNMVAGTALINNQYVMPWCAMGTLFIPVIPTSSANLAGTASILTQWWIGQGVEAFGFAGIAGNTYKLVNNRNGVFDYDAYLLKKFGGMAQAQYYFNNQWFVNAVYGYSKAYGVNRSRFLRGANQFGINNMEWAMADNAQTIQQANFTLWYRPIQAIKFGLQYSYAQATYFQYALPASSTGAGVYTPVANTTNRSNFGDEHRVEFVGFFYF
jgi:hypothetical protein